MCTITARDFRQSMKSVLDRVSEGEEIVISRGNEYFMIAPILMSSVITPNLECKLDSARKEIEKGNCVTLRSAEDIDNYFENL